MVFHYASRGRVWGLIWLLAVLLGLGCGDDEGDRSNDPGGGSGGDGSGQNLAGAGGAPRAGNTSTGEAGSGGGGVGVGGTNAAAGSGSGGAPADGECGDRAVRGDEVCDDGNDDDDDYCSNDCMTQRSCGDSEIQASADEECDDGNTTTESCEYGDEDCDVCDEHCQAILARFCGDAITNADDGEDCDDGNAETESCEYGAESCSVCTVDCVEGAGLTHECGDSVINAPDEQCDDGNATTESCAYGQQSCTVCNASCQNAPGATSYCNDGMVDAAADEDCEDSNTATEVCAYGQTSCSVCDGQCHTAAGETRYCGDNTIDSADGEECDDGDNDPLDGCDACDVVPVLECGNGTIDTGVGEDCDDGNTGNLDGCNAACHREPGWTCPVVDEDCVETCGDRMTVGDEACDDGNAVDSDYCSNDCRTRRFCGDGSTQAGQGEQCDDHNSVTEACAYGQQSCTVCDASCHSVPGATSYCGDSELDSADGEQCDEGGATETCRSDCKLQRYCIVQYALTGSYQITDTTLGLGDGTFPQSGGTVRMRLPDDGTGNPGAHASSLNRAGVLYYNMPVSFTKEVTLLNSTITTNITSNAGSLGNSCPLNRGTLAGTNVTWLSCPYRASMSGSGHCTTNWTPTHQSVPEITPTLGCLPTTAMGNIHCEGNASSCSLGGLAAGDNPINDSWSQPQNTGQFSNGYMNTVMNGLGGPTDCPAGDPSRSGSNAYTNKLETPERATSRGWISTSGIRTSITCNLPPADCD